MELSQLTAEQNALITGPLTQELTGLTYDSRAVQDGSLFVAVTGLWVDGHAYIEAALEAGARAIIAETARPSGLDAGVSWIQVPDSEVALGLAADAFYGHPSRALCVLAVTGTNGKTTVTWLLHQILQRMDHEPGLVGTVEQRFGHVRRKTLFTTPPSSDLHALLGEMRDFGCTHAAIEASSHGMAMNRLAGVHVAVAGFCNLSRDHLDYHQTMAAYEAAKWQLFERFARQACFNIDDPTGADFYQRFTGPRLSISVEGHAADLRVRALNSTLSGCALELDFQGADYAIALPLIGAFNVQNALVAAAMAILAGVDAAEVFRALEHVTPAPGRLETVPGNRHVVVDYAHTPDALANVLRALRELEPRRVICVFGAGGDRDPGKRPLMAAVAEELADRIVITSDNPRSEDPQAIVRDIQAGLKRPQNAHVQVDRQEAIEWAIAQAEVGDVVLIAGKGHEDYQIIGTERRHFDDREVARAALLVRH